jgi:hypothetical protein
MSYGDEATDFDAPLDQYLIWSNEHGAWWRANSAGYTVHMAAAGAYTRDQALSICAHARNGWRGVGAPSEIPVRRADVVDCAAMFAAKRTVSA